MVYTAKKGTGKIISELRREAGFTQKTLAEALNITDKAISKWERDLCLPDVALLPKLSMLLDVDIELLLRERLVEKNNQWVGLIDLRKYPGDMGRIVYDKPMVYYVLVHFLLLDIREIYVLCEDKEQSWFKWESLARCGFRFHVNPNELPMRNYMIMHHPCFLFGSDLTRRFQTAMVTGKATKLCPDWDITPFLFCPSDCAFLYFKNPSYLHENSIVKSLGRGMVCLPMDTADQMNDISSFVRMYQSSTGLCLADIEEIAARTEKNPL